MNRTQLNAHQRQLAGRLQNDRAALDRYAMQNWGVPYEVFNGNLTALIDVAQGRMPSGESMKWLTSQARAQYGWDQQTVRQKIGSIIDQPNPQSRIFAFLSAGGNQVTEQMFENVMEAVQTGQSQALERSLTERVNERMDRETAHQKNNLMEPSQRALEDAQSRQQLRGTIASHFRGVPQHGEDYTQRRDRVVKARLQLADRIDAEQAREMVDFANGREPQEKSIREQLSSAYDVEKVRAASIEYGFGDFNEQAQAEFDNTSAHLLADADITQGISDI